MSLSGASRELCQNISNAGKREGITGEKSSLWFEFFRIICELRPRYVIVENVSALKSRGLDRVLGDLASIGYDAEWDCIPAAAVGAPHRRDRLFIIAYPQCDPLRQQQGRGSGAEGEDSTKSRDDGKEESLANPNGERQSEWGKPDCQDIQSKQQASFRNDSGGCSPLVANSNSKGLEIGQVFGEDAKEELQAIVRAGWWAFASNVPRVVDRSTPELDETERGRKRGKMKDRVNRIKCVGNAVVPQVAEFLGRLVVKFDSKRR